MSFLKLAKERYSVRNYEAKKVSEETLRRILEAGRVAPTAANIQPQRIIVVQSEEGFEKLRKGTNIFNAPIVLIVCGDKKNVWIRPQDGKDMVDIDASIVSTHMMMQAQDEGLGSLYITWFDKVIIKKEFNLPEHIMPVNLLLIGYPEDQKPSADRHEKQRKKLEDTVFFETM